MECTSHKTEIENTFSSVRILSFDEKKNPLNNEERINSFLDEINEFKKYINKKVKKLYNINDDIIRLTWFTDLDEECLMLINDLISSAKDLRTTLIRQYVSMDYIRRKGIAKEEIKNFKNAIDELKEVYEDLESVFFFLPEIPDFIETTKQLSLI